LALVDDQRGADTRGLGDRPQADGEAVPAYLVDGGVADPGDGGQIVG
jgi:hypothetical protein